MIYSSSRGSALLSLAFLVILSLMYMRPGRSSFSLSTLERRASESEQLQNGSSSVKVPASNSTSSNSTDSNSSTSITSSIITTSSTNITTTTTETTTSTTTTSVNTTTTTATTVTNGTSTSSTSTVTSEPLTITSTSTTSTVKPSPQLKIPSTNQTSTTSTVSFTLTGFPTTSATDSDAAVGPTDTVEQNVGAASTGFWANKSAVAGTFTVVALIIVGILIGLFTCFMKKKKNRVNYEDFEKYPEPDLAPSGPPSIGHSSNELHQPAMDPFADPTYYNVVIPDYGGIPPSRHSPRSSPSQSANGHEEIYDPFANPSPQIVPASTLTSVTALPPGHPYASSASKLAPVTLKVPVDRNSYQPSIDSFYGAEQAGNAL